MTKSSNVPFEMMPDEELLLIRRPHVLAMLDIMIFWLGMLLLGILYIVYYDLLITTINNNIKITFLVKYAYDIIWFSTILIPLLIFAIFRINLGYVIVLLFLLLSNIALQWKVAPLLGLPEGVHAHLENYLLILIGTIGILGSEIFRRGHRYYLTTNRMVFRFGIIKISERNTLYSKVDDLLLQKSFIGTLLNFGTVIPLTATGLGMGQDMAILGVEAGAGKGGLQGGVFVAGGKTKNVPRDLSFYVLYKIGKPGKARNIILGEMQARERPRNTSNNS